MTNTPRPDNAKRNIVHFSVAGSPACHLLRRRMSKRRLTLRLGDVTCGNCHRTIAVQSERRQPLRIINDHAYATPRGTVHLRANHGLNHYTVEVRETGHGPVVFDFLKRDVHTRAALERALCA